QPTRPTQLEGQLVRNTKNKKQQYVRAESAYNGRNAGKRRTTRIPFLGRLCRKFRRPRQENYQSFRANPEPRQYFVCRFGNRGKLQWRSSQARRKRIPVPDAVHDEYSGAERLRSEENRYGLPTLLQYFEKRIS